jgi:iron complex outermembrane receptor protein
MTTKTLLNATTALIGVMAGSIFVSLPVCALAAPAASGPEQVGEIVVSVEKRGAESLMKVPVPVSVLDTTQLAEHEQVRIADYTNQVPGFSLAPSIAGSANLSIRGINAGGQGGGNTVGVMLDDVPFQPGGYLPEVDPGDLERIEVLRGPQGTLYGANAMGGLLRFVTVAPSTRGFSGQVSAGTNGVQNGNSPGYNLRGQVNIPLSSTLAVRVSGFRREEPGYIYNSLTNTPSINKSQAAGARAVALWRPTDKFSVQLNALSQTLANAASDEIFPALGDLTTNSPKDSSRSTLTTRSFSGIVNADLGAVHLTSITAYNTVRNNSRGDFSFSFGGFLNRFFGVQPYATLSVPSRAGTVSQELRLDTKFGQNLDVQVAGFYTRTRTSGLLYIQAPDPLTGRMLTGTAAFRYVPTLSFAKNLAAFATATYHFNDRFDVQVGGRVTQDDRETKAQFNLGVFSNPNPQFVPATEAHAKPITYLLTPRFQITPDVMIYARASSGYRAGGANTTAGVPPVYNPDKTKNYEVGLKGRFLDGMLTADLSLYHIDWNNIILSLRTAQGFVYSGNGGNAKSEGVELSMTLKPATGTTISGWFDYDKAVLTADFVNSPTYGKSGDRLPNTPKTAWRLSARQNVPLTDDLTGYGEVEANYTGERGGIFQPTALRQVYPSFTQTNLRIGVNYKAWSANAYVNNVADARGLIGGGIGYGNPSEFVLIRPRTVGVSATTKF